MLPFCVHSHQNMVTYIFPMVVEIHSEGKEIVMDSTPICQSPRAATEHSLRHIHSAIAV